MAEAAAARLGVPAERFAAFAEVFACQGARGAKNYDSLLSKVRSNAEVEAALSDLASELSFTADLSKHHDRLLFCGRYSAKVGTPLDEALRAAALGLKAADATAQAMGGPRKLKFAVRHASFGDEHLQCRKEAFPYTPSVSARHGSAVLEARCVEAVDGIGAGQLLGYVAMQGGGYVDDIGVFPAFHGQGVASGLLAGAGSVETQSGRRGATLSLDVRAANVPAIKLYERLGFQFGENTFPGFLDCAPSPPAPQLLSMQHPLSEPERGDTTTDLSLGHLHVLLVARLALRCWWALALQFVADEHLRRVG